MASSTSKRNVFEVEGINGVLRALRAMDKEGQAELRAEVQQITEKHAEALRKTASAYPDTRVQGQAPTIKAAKDRIPTIKLGGARKVRVNRNGALPSAGDVLFGTEFGAKPGPNDWRFPPAQNSYWLFQTLKGRQRDVLNEWEQAVKKVADKWSEK